MQNAPFPRLHTERVLPAIGAWQTEGKGTALVTLIAIDGGSPRPLGAQMGISETGEYVGFLSGGCLEAGLVEAS